MVNHVCVCVNGVWERIWWHSSFQQLWLWHQWPQFVHQDNLSTTLWGKPFPGTDFHSCICSKFHEPLRSYPERVSFLEDICLRDISRSRRDCWEPIEESSFAIDEEVWLAVGLNRILLEVKEEGLVVE
jgi:hypothetical protein